MVDKIKNGTDAEMFADYCAETVQMRMQNFVQLLVQLQRSDLFIEGAVQIFPVAPAERPVSKMNRSLRWSYSNRWLTVIYKQVAPLELKTPCRYSCRYLCRTLCRTLYNSACRTKMMLMQDSTVRRKEHYRYKATIWCVVQSLVQSSVQMLVQKKWQQCWNELQKWFAEMTCGNRAAFGIGCVEKMAEMQKAVQILVQSAMQNIVQMFVQ